MVTALLFLQSRKSLHERHHSLSYLFALVCSRVLKGEHLNIWTLVNPFPLVHLWLDHSESGPFVLSLHQNPLSADGLFSTHTNILAAYVIPPLCQETVPEEAKSCDAHPPQWRCTKPPLPPPFASYCMTSLITHKGVQLPMRLNPRLLVAR